MTANSKTTDIKYDNDHDNDDHDDFNDNNDDANFISIYKTISNTLWATFIIKH